MNDILLLEKSPPIAWLKLNRPDVLNCLNRQLLTELINACKKLQEDKSTRVVVVIGSGTKSFCAGADLTERKGMNEKETLDYIALIQQAMLAIENLPQVTIAAINGHSYGGGTELALSCDLRMMTAESTMRLTEVKLGIIPGAGGTQRLPRLIGKSLAKELILTARPITAEQAHSVGLVHHIVPANTAGTSAFHQELCLMASSWSKEIATAAPLALRQAKYAIDAGFDKELSEGLAIETQAYLPLLHTKDRKEGLLAFAEKRQPVYTGE